MNWAAVSFDWNQVRAFLATIEEGSLSGAARALGQTQPTLSRQVTALESHLEVTLFKREPRAMVLTDAGLELVDHVRAMGEAAARLSLSASGQSQTIEGHVSITATDTTATYLLPPVIAEIAQAAPNINVELIASNDRRDLTRREADIAIRNARPQQQDLIAVRVANSAAHLYASQAYLDRAGQPDNASDLLGMSFVGTAPIEPILPTLRPYGLDLTASQFAVTTASGTAQVELVRQGIGIGILPHHAARHFADLVPVLQDAISIPFPVWLVTHRALHTSRRIRVDFDLLKTALAGSGT